MIIGCPGFTSSCAGGAAVATVGAAANGFADGVAMGDVTIDPGVGTGGDVGSGIKDEPLSAPLGIGAWMCRAVRARLGCCGRSMSRRGGDDGGLR